ncbi:TadE family protein [Blastococcus sp. Marseille-P5729]|uniref:TadE family protein n=1 Tax=Blastococcus sp. Marseille-P5729 TaxID=2086582 RepID=UPI000D0FFE78|nr:TadE/TadG family type IV pilus assembly protein [Blastococcus sp. Marseille-P5729]
MPSTRSPASNHGREGERGSAIVEFSMVAVLLSALFFVVLQVGIYLYQRSVISSSALAGARFAANANVDTTAGGPRAAELISDALSDGVLDGVSCTATEEVGADGLVLVVVECSGSVPSIVSALGPLLPIDATARVIEEGQ